MDTLTAFRDYLLTEEKSTLTVAKYLRDVKAFLHHLGTGELNKSVVLHYKETLAATYALASANSMLSSINAYLRFLGREDCRVKTLRHQRQIFRPEGKELSREEYVRLLRAARDDQRLYLLMQTICATGIRVSEHRFITVETLRQGYAEVMLKGKLRTVFFPRALCKPLLAYARRLGIHRGSIFVTTSGQPLDRSRIWAMMKALCTRAGVAPEKVFPHNLRHLFARIYYTLEKDIVRLADILGHSSINTTRIYTMESGDIHRKQIEKMRLVYIT